MPFHIPPRTPPTALLAAAGGMRRGELCWRSGAGCWSLARPIKPQAANHRAGLILEFSSSVKTMRPPFTNRLNLVERPNENSCYPSVAGNSGVLRGPFARAGRRNHCG
jgi:hypothetical protein